MYVPGMHQVGFAAMVLAHDVSTMHHLPIVVNCKLQVAFIGRDESTLEEIC